MMKKLVGNVMSVLLEVFMWITFIGSAIGGLGFGYTQFGVIGAVGGLVLGAIAGMLLNTGFWLISVIQEIRNYSKKWRGKYKTESDSPRSLSSPTPIQIPDFRSMLAGNGDKIAFSLVSLVLLVGIIWVAKNFPDSNVEGNKAAHKEVGGSFTDSRDNQTYGTIKIGTQTWMAENLNYKVRGSRCYNNDPDNCEEYGRLYDWETALNACPKGWHLPSNDEWEVLYRFVDGTSGTEKPYSSKTAGKYLKAKSGWNYYEGSSGNGTDDYGFTALPGGLAHPDGKLSSAAGNYGNWWSSSEYDDDSAYNRFKSYKHNNAGWETEAKSKLFSVRCLMG